MEGERKREDRENERENPLVLDFNTAEDKQLH